MLHHLHLQPPAKLATLTLCALLAACGGDSDTPADPLRAYRSQTLQWQACTAEVLGKEALDPRTLAQYGNRLQCAQVRAPMDWSDPAKGDVKVAVMRLASTNPAQRKASLLLNPGGPGVDRLSMGIRLDQIFEQARTDSSLGAKFQQLREQYDLVGFSPRGLGASTNLECTVPDTAASDSRKTAPALPSELVEQEINNADLKAKALAEACKGAALKPYINSDATARDMDLLRGLLGDDKLHYFGYSYGTWLGAWYAGLFPEKVGRMVLDSVQDFTSNHEDDTRVMGPARERIHSQVMLSYFTRHAADFGLDVSTTPLAQQVNQLDVELHHELGNRLAGQTYGASQLNTYGETLAAAVGLQAIVQKLPETSTPQDLQQALADHVFHPSNLERDSIIRKIAMNMVASLSPTPDSARAQTLPVGEAVFWAVGCNDASTIRDMGAWRTALRQDAAEAPLFFSAISHCIDWGVPSVNKPEMAQLQSVNALIVQSQYDGATPAEGSARTFARMPAAKQVYVPGEYVHALFPYASQDGDDPCVDHAVLDYLLGSNAAPRSTTCGARPLALDRATTKSASAEGSAYRDPAAAQALIESFHSTIGPRR
jgi:pimeloyl-ACP methyl ester carboxylesterase